jgi:hypothetical protein
MVYDMLANDEFEIPYVEKIEESKMSENGAKYLSWEDG